MQGCSDQVYYTIHHDEIEEFNSSKSINLFDEKTSPHEVSNEECTDARPRNYKYLKKLSVRKEKYDSIDEKHLTRSHRLKTLKIPSNTNVFYAEIKEICHPQEHVLPIIQEERNFEVECQAALSTEVVLTRDDAIILKLPSKFTGMNRNLPKNIISITPSNKVFFENTKTYQMLPKNLFKPNYILSSDDKAIGFSTQVMLYLPIFACIRSRSVTSHSES